LADSGGYHRVLQEIVLTAFRSFVLTNKESTNLAACRNGLAAFNEEQDRVLSSVRSGMLSSQNARKYTIDLKRKHERQI
jgi:hypothetical protein